MSYEKLEDRFKRIGTLGEAAAILGWDMQTVMPKGGAGARSDQLALMRVMEHELLSDERVGEWLQDAAADESLDEWRRANVAEMRRSWIHATAVDADLVQAHSLAGSECFMKWQSARGDNDFAGLAPSLSKVLGLTRQVAAAKGEALGLSPYDAMIDTFEPDGRASDIDTIFAPLRAELPGLVAEIEARQNSAGAKSPLEGPFPIAQQEKVGRQLMQAIGFDFDHGRLDVSHHPFCGGIPDDVRVTTRYREDAFDSALMGVVHETGHAMYERQLPADWRRQPVGQARGMGMHESQSLLVEMQACRSPEFIRFVAPLLRDAFGKSGDAWQPANLQRHYLNVERGLIRVDADEVTYPLHVILRFELEQKLFADELEIADLPTAWGEAMEKYLGIRPADDRDGCMQDVHWTDGAFGYFPSYTLGAIAAAQLFQAAVEASPEIPGAIERGDFSGLMAWLRTNVHSRASSVSSHEILTDATGRSFDSKSFLAHLRRRYLSA